MHNRLVPVLAALLAVAACGKNGKTDGAAVAQAPTRAATAASDPVAAVLQSTGAPAAKLGFTVLVSPVVGVQSGVRIDISVAEPAPALLVTAEGDGIAIDPASARVSFSLATAGATASHELRIVPEREGLGAVTVRLRKDADSPETVYVIPVLAAKTAAGG